MEDQGSMTLEESYVLIQRLKESVAESIFGQESLITESICCLLSGGHILMTGAPGLAKTTLVRVFAQFLNLAYGRVQFTPDLLPGDIIGSDILNIDTDTGKRSFEFAQGPIFANLLLADEINRASPRTQSALLEAMQERAVTVGGKRYALPYPFMVFATQNPFESEGAFPLPEAQLDRFLIHTLVDYPSAEAESQILKEHADNRLVGEQQVDSQEAERDRNKGLTLIEIRNLIKRREAIVVENELVDMIRDLVRSTRPTDELCPASLRELIWYGAGPRAGISLISVARSLALLEKDDKVRWKHIRRMAKPVLRHRIRLSAQTGGDRLNEDEIIDRILERLEDRLKMGSQAIE